MRNKLRKVSVLACSMALAILFFSSQVFASAGGIQGRILNSVGSTPVAGVTVTAGSYTATTGSDGRFSMSVANATYTVAAAKSLFHTLSISGVVVSGSMVDLGDRVLPFNHFGFPGGDLSMPHWEHIIDSATINALNLQAGDELAIFDGATCVGLLILTAPVHPNLTQSMFAYASLTGGGGYTVGHTATYKCYNYSAGGSAQECSSVTVAHSNPWGTAYMSDVFPPDFYRYSFSSLYFSCAAPTLYTVDGTVKDGFASPISGATVTIDGFSGTTNGAGYFSTTLPNGTYTLTISKPTFATYSHSETVSGADLNLGIITLGAAPATLSGTFTALSSGLPISGATVTADDGLGHTFTGTSSGSGSYSVNITTSGSYDITASKSGYVSQSLLGYSITVGSSYNENFAMSAADHFTDVAGDASNTVWTLYVNSASLGGNALTYDDEIAVYDGSTICGKFTFDGPLSGNPYLNELVTFRVNADGDVLFTGGDAVTFKCWSLSQGTEATGTATFVSGSGLYAPGTSIFPTYSLPTDNFYSLVNLTFALTPGTLAGHVRNSVTHYSLSGVSVSAVSGSHTYTGTTNGSGDFSIGSVSPGTYTVTFTKGGYVTQTVTGQVVSSGGTTTMTTIDLVQSTGSQDVTLNTGLVWVSTYIGKVDGVMKVDSLVRTVGGLAPGEFNFAKNSDGDVYHTGTWITDFTWDPLQGYVFSMNNHNWITIDGVRIYVGTPISIDNSAGASPLNRFISYLPETGMNASTALNTILNNGSGHNVTWVKDDLGHMIRYIGGWVNNIGNMNPGQGYQVQVPAHGTVNLVYPSSKSNEVLETGDNKPTHFQVNGDAAGYVYTIYLNVTQFGPGDEIAAYDGDRLVGATKIVAGGPFTNAIPVFRVLTSGPGFVPGDPITLKGWDVNQQKEMQCLYTIQDIPSGTPWMNNVYPEGEAKYSLFKISKWADGISEPSNLVFSVYPNPANDFLKVVANQNIDKVALLDVLGRTVIEKTVETRETQLNVAGLNAGIYILQITVNGQVSTRKVFIN